MDIVNQACAVVVSSWLLDLDITNSILDILY